MDAWLEYIDGLSLAAPTWMLGALAVGLLVAAWLLIAVARRSRLMMRKMTRVSLVVVTILTLALLAAALARVLHTKQEKHLAVALLVDGSASIPDAELERARQWLGDAYGRQTEEWLRTLVFAKTPRLAAAGEAGKTPDLERPEQTRGTNIARALQQAIELFPPNHTRRAVLLTDGNQTAGDLLAAANQAAAHGVEVSVLVLETRDDRDLYIEAINIPAAARPGERIQAGVVVVANYQTAARLHLTLGGKSIFDRQVELQPGRNIFETETVIADQSAVAFKAGIEEENDKHPENNELSAAITVRAQPRVAFFSARLEQDLPLVEALDAAKLQVDPADAARLPDSVGALYPYDVVVLSDPDYGALSKAQQEALMEYVQQGGGGVVAIGGDHTGELGKKDNKAPIKKMMPVAFKEKKKTEPDPVTLILIIDKSASMARQRKFVMAVAAANETIDALADKSRLGVIFFDDFPRWAIPLQEVRDAENKRQMQETLRSFGVDGGTSLYPAISEAYKKLKDDPAKVKHIILLTDGISLTTYNQWGHLVEWMGGKRITISTVALGSESDQEHLKKIASVGKGRFYFTEDVAQIPRIFLEETKQITKTGAVEKKFAPHLLKKGELLANLPLEKAPELTGYNTSDPKPTSEVFLTADRNEPLLSRWRYGLGWVTVLNTDSGLQWAKSWRAWSAYGSLMAALVRGSMAELALRNYRIETSADEDSAEVRVDATDQFGNFVEDSGLQLHITDPDGEETTVALEQTRPGGYEGKFPVAAFGSYSLRVEPAGGGLHRSQGSGRIHLAPPPEFVATQPDRPLLSNVAALGGGRVNPTPAEVLAAPEVEYPQRKPLSKYLLYAALAGILLALLIRRGLLGG